MTDINTESKRWCVTYLYTWIFNIVVTNSRCL